MPMRLMSGIPQQPFLAGCMSQSLCVLRQAALPFRLAPDCFLCKERFLLWTEAIMQCFRGTCMKLAFNMC